MTSEVFQLAKACVVTVRDGRGFIVERGHRRFVITAAHCLANEKSRLPFLCKAYDDSQRICQKLLAPLGDKPAIWAECVFADPLDDIAVLGEPPRGTLRDIAEHIADEGDEGAYGNLDEDAYEKLVNAATPISIADAYGNDAWLLSLDGRWFHCNVDGDRDQFPAPLFISDANENIWQGMSGSPIISAEGLAIGVICCIFGGSIMTKEGGNAGGPNPRLADHLPGWLLPLKWE